MVLFVEPVVLSFCDVSVSDPKSGESKPEEIRKVIIVIEKNG